MTESNNINGPREELKMRILSRERNVFSIQKCLLPVCGFLKQNYGRYCIVSQNSCKFIVKIGLCDVKQLGNVLFLDTSVSIFSSFGKALRTENLHDISFENFRVLGKPEIAKTVKVVVVFNDFLNVKKYKNSQRLGPVVRDILKLFVISNNSLVFLTNLPDNQKFGINCIIIEDVRGLRSCEIFRTDSGTDVVVEKCVSLLKFEESQEEENQVRVGGCSQVYSILKETLDFSKCLTNRNVKFVNKLLLIGPPGCGKTTLVHNVANDSKFILLEITPCIINTLPPGEMERKLESIFEEAKVYAEHHECCLILIENIDLMSSGKTLHAKRFVGHMITLLEMVDNMQGIVVVATTNNPDEVDLQLRRPKRLEDELEIMIPTAEERVEILEKILDHCKVEFRDGLLQEVANWTPGFVGADLRLLVVEALMMLNKQGSLPGIDQDLLKECFKLALKKVIPSSLRGAVGLCTSNNMTFSQLGGLEAIKNILDLSVKRQLENPERFEEFGIPLTKGILLYGPPGCAKTTLVKALANECNTTFIATSAAELYSPFVGDAEKKIIQLFSQARIGSPSILFIDEIDAVVGSKSGDRERGVQERILSTLLIEMDGVGLKVNTQRDNSLNLLGDGKEIRGEMNLGVIVIGATNRPQMLDDALKRPGRFDRLLYIPPPDELERFRILKKITEKVRLHESVDLNRLAKLTDFYSGADLKNLVQEAGLHALKSTGMAAECIHQSDFEYILSEYKPSLNEKVIAFYESFQKLNV